MEFVVICG